MSTRVLGTVVHNTPQHPGIKTSSWNPKQATTWLHQPVSEYLDIALPGMDGYEVAKRLRRKHSFVLALDSQHPRWPYR
jgi:CheY-like chemotaxis protein